MSVYGTGIIAFSYLYQIAQFVLVILGIACCVKYLKSR